MKKISAKTATNVDNQPAKNSGQNTALHLCYGQIGISAVAAAVRYQGGAKNPAYAPAAIGSYQEEATVA